MTTEPKIGAKVRYLPLADNGFCEAEITAVRTPFMVDLKIKSGFGDPLELRYIVLIKPGREILPGCCALAEENAEAISILNCSVWL